MREANREEMAERWRRVRVKTWATLTGVRVYTSILLERDKDFIHSVI